MRKLLIIIGITLFATSCNEEVVDFLDVTNPNLLEEDLIGQDNSTVLVIEGIKRQVAFLLNETITISEIASDNYDNTQTFFNQQLDNLSLDIRDGDFNALLVDIGRLREQALFGLNQIGPADANFTEEQRAELLFYEGLSYLIAGDYFLATPIETGGELITSQGNYETAAERFRESANINSTFINQLGLAKAYYRLGNKNNAIQAAQAAIDIDSDGLLLIQFDEASPFGPSNTIEDALFERGSFDDLQPLPSLDFLDPKFRFLTADEDQPVPLFKAEEAYLILAEANLADSNLDVAKANMNDLIDLVESRTSEPFNDAIEGRAGSRPDTTDIRVRYEGQEEFRSGLILDRQNGNITVPSISGTSITKEDVEMLSDPLEALEMLYLMRQEIFIAEGVRIVDLGVRYLIPENEILLNSNISEGDFGTVPMIPDFINSIRTELDTFTYDTIARTVEIKHNLNRILVDNRTSEQVLPFH